MPTNSTHTNIRRLAAVVVAGGVFGVAGVYAIASAEQSSAPDGHDQRAVAEWATSRGLSGLSPASLGAGTPTPMTRAETADRLRQVAAWAEARGLAGLSPASLTAAEPAPLTRAETADRLRQVAEWAEARGLSGLSPASLTRVDD